MIKHISKVYIYIYIYGGGGGMGDLSPPPILLHITIWLNILIYTILLSRFDLTGHDL